MGATRLETTSDQEYTRHRTYYEANREQLLARAKARYKERGPAMRRAMQRVREAERQERLRKKSTRGPNRAIEKARAFVLAHKTGKACVDCRVVYPPYVLDFDHVRGTKRADISTMVWKGRSVRILQTEIDKCDLVCANCHRERTHAPTC